MSDNEHTFPILGDSEIFRVKHLPLAVVPEFIQRIESACPGRVRNFRGLDEANDRIRQALTRGAWLCGDSYTAADSPLGKNSVYTFAGSRRNVLWIVISSSVSHHWRLPKRAILF